MKILYSPHFRDAESVPLRESSFSFRGYVPRYVDVGAPREKEERVVAQVETRKEDAEVPDRKEPDKRERVDIFKTRDSFKSALLPAYSRALVRMGLDPAFAKVLTAQSALESAWGKKPSGLYNYGGVKGPGTTGKTREVINGKDEYIRASFRDFRSLEDYVNYKVKLLNGPTYKAFDGGPSEFARRVHRGGYATDPRYEEVLNGVIRSMQEGGNLAKGKEWVENWYNSRSDKIRENAQETTFFPVGDLARKFLLRNMGFTRASINPGKVPEVADGVYYPHVREIYLRNDNKSDAVHEWAHSSEPKFQIKKIEKIKDFLGEHFYENSDEQEDSYLDSPSEIYARVMELREAYNIDPNHTYTDEEVEEMKRSILEKQYLFTGSDRGLSTTVFDKDNNIIQIDPLDSEAKYDYNDTKLFRLYDDSKAFNILNRLSTPAIRMILNDVASVGNKKEPSLYAKLGMKIPKFQWSGVLRSEYDNPEDYYDYPSGAYDGGSGHWSSNGSDGLLLKNPRHPTAFMSYDHDRMHGYKWYKGYDDRIYSKEPWQAALNPLLKREPLSRDSVNHPVSIKGFKNVDKVYNHLINLGATKEQAAGLTGVFIKESGLRHGAVSSAGARGIAQLKEGRLKQYRRWLGSRPDTWQNQVTFVWDHINRGKDDWQSYYDSLKESDPKVLTEKERNDWKSMKDSKWVNYSYDKLRKTWGGMAPGDIAEEFTWTFERPREHEADIDHRRDYAQQVYDLMNK